MCLLTTRSSGPAAGVGRVWPRRGLLWRPLNEAVRHHQMTAAGRTYFGPKHSFLAVAAGLCIFFGANEIGQRMLIEIDGTIVSSQTTPGPRRVTTYVLRSADGQRREYVAGATDRSLPRDLPVGTHVSKHRYELSWRLNERKVDDFPVWFYLGACLVGAALAYFAFAQWQLNRPKGGKGDA